MPRRDQSRFLSYPPEVPAESPHPSSLPPSSSPPGPPIALPTGTAEAVYPKIQQKANVAGRRTRRRNAMKRNGIEWNGKKRNGIEWNGMRSRTTGKYRKGHAYCLREGVASISTESPLLYRPVPPTHRHCALWIFNRREAKHLII